MLVSNHADRADRTVTTCCAGSAGAGRTAMLNASLVSSEVDKGFQAVSTAGLENLLKPPIAAVNTQPSSGQKNLRKPAIGAATNDPVRS